MKEYRPEKIERPERVSEAPSAWRGLDCIIDDIMERFNVGGDRALEFGVEFGFSAVALSNFFDEVIAVDHFKGDVDSGERDVSEVAEEMCDYPNITLVKSSYEDYIKEQKGYFDLIHIDIMHNYEDTFKCGVWSAKNSGITIFHDTESFPEVKRAVKDIAKETGKESYNYPHHHGLGIVV